MAIISSFVFLGVLTAPVAGPRHTSSEGTHSPLIWNMLFFFLANFPVLGLCLPSPQNSGQVKTSFHDVVMSYRDKSHSRELKELLCNITLEQFQEIRGSCLSPIVSIMLCATETTSWNRIFGWGYTPHNCGLVARWVACSCCIEFHSMF